MMENYTVVSFSGGKDSTAMLLGMMEKGEKINEVLNIDTGKEFPEMYYHIDKIRRVVEKEGIEFTILKSPYSFEYWMLEKPIRSEKHGDHTGYGWPTSQIRWCTKNLKTDLLSTYIKALNDKYNVIQCVGLAADETKRLTRNQNKQHRHPLVEWGWTEKDCLDYCYSKGYDFYGLYEIFNRVSCWCCPLARIDELRKLWKNFPALWNILQDWENEINRQGTNKIQFKDPWTVEALTARFEHEEYLEKCQTHLDSWIVIE